MKVKTLTKQQAQTLGIKSSFLSEKCSGRIFSSPSYYKFSKPTIKTKRTSF